MSKVFPAISLTGPRQSGKTTCVRHTFPDYHYYNFENPDIREEATQDPRGFLHTHQNGVILDEVQKVPILFNYLQQVLDDSKQMGRYILSGSHNFLLLEKITQSLAGRVANLHLFPFTQEELSSEENPLTNIDEIILKGGYPVLFDRDIHPTE